VTNVLKSVMAEKHSTPQVQQLAETGNPLSDLIKIRGARANNLKNIDLDIPKHKLVVITGVSGSGKSSLAFDTIYAEGQRRYVESLSSYARQFLGLMEKPDVDLIEGLAPAISIDQKSAGHNPRSTVGTVTEVYDYLRLLFARVGHPRSPISGKRLQKQSVQQIVDDILNYPQKFSADEVKIQILAPLVKDRKGTYEELFQRLLSQGYLRVRVNGEVFNLEEEIKLDRYKKHTIDVVLDRLVVKTEQGTAEQTEEFMKRLTDSIEQALNLGERELYINLPDTNEDKFYSEKLVDPESGTSFPEIEPHSFSFNSPHGACTECNGLGFIREIDPQMVYNPRLSVTEGGIFPWSRMADNMDSWYMRVLETVGEEEGFSLRMSLGELKPEHLKIILYGTGERKFTYKHTTGDGRQNTYNVKYEGVIPNLQRRYQQTESDYIRQEIEEFMRDRECETCKGLRLKKESLAVSISGANIVDVSNMAIQDALQWVDHLQGQGEQPEFASTLKVYLNLPEIDIAEDQLSAQEKLIAIQVLKEIRARLNFLVAVGLDYLTLSRRARTLSGGESQRIRLASQIGTGLTGVLYVLDEPSIGLHQRDNERLIGTLTKLRDLGNTVIVVEHDEDTIRVADYIVDIGPRAGEHGGEVVATGTYAELVKNENSLTGKYVSGELRITKDRIYKELEEIGITPGSRPNPHRIFISGMKHNNLKGIEVEIPLGKFVTVTGVSGSGKSSFVNEILHKILAKELNGASELPGDYKEIRGVENLDKVIQIDQSPIGRTPRSNPATYTGVFTPMREIFASTQEAKTRGYGPGRFSFNVKGGRCENCGGDGMIKIEMQFLPDVYVKCEVCNGKRYNRETLQIDFKGKNIADVLDMTVEEGVEFFTNVPKIAEKLQTLNDVGLGYIRLGQAATTLSGGEAQRVKLAAELSKRQTGKTIYILDEPTTGLHFDDVRRLLVVLHGLVARGNSVLVIEHNLDVIKTADWVIDLGPEGGDKGGYIIAEGTPNQVAAVKESYTGQWLSKVL
jgi:excinuclease ABC subunit A